MTCRRPRTTRRASAAVTVVGIAVALSLGACNRGSTTDAAGDAERSATTSTVPVTGQAPSTDPGAPAPDPSGTAAGTGTPDKAKFCDATTVLITVPDDQTPQQYEAAVAMSTATMVASVPDRSLVPLMAQMQQAYALYAQVASAEAADDPDGAARKVAEAETIFPPADQRRFAEYVKRECDVDIGS